MKQCSYCVFSKMQLLKDKHTIWENENYLYFIQIEFIPVLENVFNEIFENIRTIVPIKYFIWNGF